MEARHGYPDFIIKLASTLLGLFTFDTAKDEEPPGHSSAETFMQFNYRAPETFGDIVQATMRKPMFAP